MPCLWISIHRHARTGYPPKGGTRHRFGGRPKVQARADVGCPLTSTFVPVLGDLLGIMRREIERLVASLNLSMRMGENRRVVASVRDCARSEGRRVVR